MGDSIARREAVTDAKIVAGILYGYLPFRGEIEIMTDESSVVRHFQVSGKAWAAMLDRPDCYVHLIGRPVLADVEPQWGMIVGLRLMRIP